MAATIAEITDAVPNLYAFKPIINEFVKSSFIIDKLPFVEMAQPTGNHEAYTYTYYRKTVQSTAATRAVNVDYTESISENAPFSTTLSIFGGKFSLDRVMQQTGFYSDWLSMQVDDKRQAAIAKLNDLFINGDTAVDANGFDGIAAAVEGTTTEYNTGTFIDMSTSAKIDANYKEFDYQIGLWLALMKAGKPSAFFLNSTMKQIFIEVGKRFSANSIVKSEVEAGQFVEYDAYRGIPLVDLKEKSGSEDDVVVTETRTIDGVPGITNLTDVYACLFGANSVHGVAPTRNAAGGTSLINIYLPRPDLDNTDAGVNRAGAVELFMGLALEKTKGAGVFKNIKIAV